MTGWVAFAVLLFIMCSLLLIAEVLIPSMGILTVMALLCAAGGVAIFFKQSPAFGWAGVIVAMFLIPASLIVAYRIMPHTSFGRNLMLAGPQRLKGDGISDVDELAKLPGSEGFVVSTMRPVGMCLFDGKRVECIAQSGFLQKGRRVKVIKVEGTQVTVKQVDEKA